MMTSVNALYNSLRNEQKVNNFTNRTGKVIYDLEASIIVARIINKVTLLFKSGMNSITEDTISMINVKRLFKIKYLLDSGHYISTFWNHFSSYFTLIHSVLLCK